jgi:hypothetical protein
MFNAGWQWGRTEIPVDMLVPSRALPGRKREVVRSFAEMDPLGKNDRRFLAKLRKGPLHQQRLQQSFGRDFSAGIFKHILDGLVAGRYVFLHHGSLYLTRKGAEAMGYKNACMCGFVEFTGNLVDPPSVPVRFRKYWITSIPGPAAGSCIVTIRPLTRMTPVPEPASFLVPTGGPQQAFLDAVSRLPPLFQNDGLRCSILDG